MASADTLLKKPLGELENLGAQMLFYGRVLKAVPFTIKNYSKEIMRLLAELNAQGWNDKPIFAEPWSGRSSRCTIRPS